MSDIRPSVLTVAGSDSGGGAGIQADLRTFHAMKVYGCSVVTAVTAQNPYEVRSVEVMPAESVRVQFESVLDAIPVRFAKTGMLAGREIVGCVAELAGKYSLQLVVDPVMVSTSGTRLLEAEAISVMQKSLFPLAQWLTPNIPEAELLCGREVKDFSGLAAAAQMIYRQYGCNCLLKSGHAISSDMVTDVVCCNGELFALSSPVVNVAENSTHGTGCTLSAALAANLASGKSWRESLVTAKAFVYGSLCESTALSDKLTQMYPPEEDYCTKVTLEKL